MQRIFTFEMQFIIHVPAYSFKIRKFSRYMKKILSPTFKIIIPGTWHVAELLTQCIHQKVDGIMRKSDQQIRKKYQAS